MRVISKPDTLPKHCPLCRMEYRVKTTLINTVQRCVGLAGVQQSRPGIAPPLRKHQGGP